MTDKIRAYDKFYVVKKSLGELEAADCVSVAPLLETRAYSKAPQLISLNFRCRRFDIFYRGKLGRIVRDQFEPEYATHPDGAFHTYCASHQFDQLFRTTRPMPVPSTDPASCPSRLNC